MVDVTSPSFEAQNTVLEMADVWLTLPEHGSQGLAADLTISPGELVLIDADDGQSERLLTDAVCGLKAPARGTIRFQGRDWAGLPPDIANARRGRIGSATSRSPWLPYLSLLDNILLQQLHHTRRALDDIREEAARLAYRFGMLGLPADLPGSYSDAQLRRAALVRAFLGEPALVLIGAHETSGAEAMLTPLMNTIREARDRGAAVICFTLDSAFGRDESLPISQSYAIHGGRLHREGTTP
jgi:phospholipid/cholesterol/gamma-HCH transport system ATP-binding protein